MSDRRIFPKDFADRFIDQAGQKYEPSNGTEGLIFEEAYCQDCKLYSAPCKIWRNAICFKKSDDNYPCELQYGRDGQPTCTAFQEFEERFVARHDVLIDRIGDRHLSKLPEFESMQDVADFLNGIFQTTPESAPQ